MPTILIPNIGNFLYQKCLSLPFINNNDLFSCLYCHKIRFAVPSEVTHFTHFLTPTLVLSPFNKICCVTPPGDKSAGWWPKRINLIPHIAPGSNKIFLGSATNYLKINTIASDCLFIFNGRKTCPSPCPQKTVWVFQRTNNLIMRKNSIFQHTSHYLSNLLQKNIWLSSLSKSGAGS